MDDVPDEQKPAGPPPKNRLLHGPRDMIMSLAVLLVIIAALLLFTKSCSFSPGGPEIDQSAAPTADLSAAFSQVADTLDFPLRLPAVPDAWRPNSTSTAPAGPTSVVVRAGWLTGAGFAQLSQSAATPNTLVEIEGGTGPATGSVEIDGTQWTVHPGRRAESVWVTRLGDTTLLITGSAPEPDFRTLASATLKAQPITK
ncbi:DUF4245 domain-containing protein [Actinokineospora pegani]|uniref:DUF4245 domain-containing protein n=1 Tax=Actinokineospora pegani TaxID=2654637 RepID=UPI0012E9EDB5|nr:DUF4245 domain-containing protein [Actinokineospora pegani]